VEARLRTTGAVALVLFLALGLLVTTTPFPSLDIAAASLHGHGVQAAVIFTESGRFLALAVLGLIGAAILAASRMPWWVGAGVLLSEAASQGVIALVKPLFHRARPEYWLVYHESGFSYPSGHASTAIVFFGSWLLIVLLSPLPRMVKYVSTAIIFAWMIGIDWSRLALGAHYATDVIGGTLFGIAWVSALLAVLVHFGFTADLHGATRAHA
jgi:membrane-associated phospholipid phosphatase